MIQVIIDDSIRARLRCLTIFSTIFQLNRGDQFHRWRKQGYQDSVYDNDGVTFLYICLIIGCKGFLVIYIISVNNSGWFTVHISSLHFVDVIVAMLIFVLHKKIFRLQTKLKLIIFVIWYQTSNKYLYSKCWQ
jgi:hypothetical protein